MRGTDVQRGSGASHEPLPQVMRRTLVQEPITRPRLRPLTVAAGTAEDDAGEVHFGKDGLDVGTEGDAKTIAKTVTDHKDSDSEFQEHVPNTVDSVAGVQKFVIEPDDECRQAVRKRLRQERAKRS